MFEVDFIGTQFFANALLLHENGIQLPKGLIFLYTYRTGQKLPSLLPSSVYDFDRRLEFCEWVQHLNFTFNGIYREIRTQALQKLNVCDRIHSDAIVVLY